MERDEETGLAYHGARYYAAWLGRWCSTDPEQLVDGPNLFRACRNAPTNYIDSNGRNPILVVVFALAMSFALSNDGPVADPAADRETRATISEVALAANAKGLPVGFLNRVATDPGISFGRGGQITPSNPLGISNVYNAFWNEVYFSQETLENSEFFDFTFYHELTHAYVDLEGEDGGEDFAILAANSIEYYQTAPLKPGKAGAERYADDPHRLFQEATATYVEHRMAIWGTTYALLHGTLAELGVSGEKLDVNLTRDVVEAAKSRYNKAMAQDAFGYQYVDGEQVDTTKAIFPQLREYLDRHVLEGRISSNFDDDPQLTAMYEEIRRKAGW